MVVLGNFAETSVDSSVTVFSQVGSVALGVQLLFFVYAADQQLCSRITNRLDESR